MDMGLGGLWELVIDREAWRAVVHEFSKSRTFLSDWTELNWTEVFSTAQNSRRDSELSREEKGDGGDRGDLGEKRESQKGREQSNLQSHRQVKFGTED